MTRISLVRDSIEFYHTFDEATKYITFKRIKVARVVTQIFQISHVHATIEFPESLLEFSRETHMKMRKQTRQKGHRERRENPFIHGSLKVDCT